ncbi:MAG TPA: transcription elongation factor GreA [Gaiellaceae bacterium]
MEDVRPEKEVLLTREGLEKLKAEIEDLRTRGRRDVAERIREALHSGGELSENQEYLDAKEEQARLEARILVLEERLANARVIQRTRKPPEVVGVGTRVRLKDMDANETVEYQIVGSAEANPAEQKLSNESPVGRAIIGRKKGETVEVAAPRGSLKYKILDIKAA